MEEQDQPGASALAERLERGEIVSYPVCPFLLPAADDRDFLFQQALGGRAHKNISYDPATGRVGGCRWHTAQPQRLGRVLAAFADRATSWLASTLPRYARCWRPDRATFRPEEEATRRLRLTARNDLLHIDAFPTRPSCGWRILRLFVNLHPSEPRIWATADTFPALLERYEAAVGLPIPGVQTWAERLGRRLLGLVRPEIRRRSDYDVFMLRLHDFLKGCDDFQEHSRKRLWHFKPGSAWLVFTDTLSHAELRGRYALEHSYFVCPETLALPDESPAALLARACAAVRSSRVTRFSEPEA
ncbi:MAG: Kdo hydroxylase family protein [Gemmataceae bacterium]|nr:Kdo hydroxylase family protein [Gemmataceae bacterium]